MGSGVCPQSGTEGEIRNPTTVPMAGACRGQVWARTNGGPTMNVVHSKVPKGHLGPLPLLPSTSSTFQRKRLPEATHRSMGVWGKEALRVTPFSLTTWYWRPLVWGGAVRGPFFFSCQRLTVNTLARLMRGSLPRAAKLRERRVCRVPLSRGNEITLLPRDIVMS